MSEFVVSRRELLRPTESCAWWEIPAAHQPEWPDPTDRDRVVRQLALMPAIVRPEDCDTLRERLAEAAQGELFVLQAGDCAESFADHTESAVLSRARLLDQMASVLAMGLRKPVETIGRIGGQYAKPRSQATETIEDITLPTYFGDIVNGPARSTAARTLDPQRLLHAYRYSSMVTRHLEQWDIRRVFTSHEALILDYESPLARRDPMTGAVYGTSGHLLWIGDRTRHSDHAHVTFGASIANPVAVKLGPTTSAEEAVKLANRLNPAREHGRLTFITRLGTDRVESILPDLIEAIAGSAVPVVWMCDPMHGNTFTVDGYKTRRFGDILAELARTVRVHARLGSWLGGMHLEVSDADVTECLGGQQRMSREELPKRYQSLCDPRLNRSQALEFCVRAADVLRPAQSHQRLIG